MQMYIGTYIQFFPASFRISHRHHVSLLEILLCVFPKNKDVLYNYSTVQLWKLRNPLLTK